MIEFYVKQRDLTRMFRSVALLAGAEWVRDTHDGWSVYQCTEEGYGQIAKKFSGRLKRA